MLFFVKNYFSYWKLLYNYRVDDSSEIRNIFKYQKFEKGVLISHNFKIDQQKYGPRSQAKNPSKFEWRNTRIILEVPKIGGNTFLLRPGCQCRLFLMYFVVETSTYAASAVNLTANGTIMKLLRSKMWLQRRDLSTSTVYVEVSTNKTTILVHYKKIILSNSTLHVEWFSPRLHMAFVAGNFRKLYFSQNSSSRGYF